MQQVVGMQLASDHACRAHAGVCSGNHVHAATVGDVHTNMAGSVNKERSQTWCSYLAREQLVWQQLKPLLQQQSVRSAYQTAAMEALTAAMQAVLQDASIMQDLA